ncbi:hypothetical protein [Mucilaginibacter sp. L196]|uniref:hypothetical protein n=1 Tax=Mucilaginibacter sp. L196 TaxID=1641870 RepID=UPI00131AFE13|nr:hypothetical protein [Mucilaginibacter sp. L196]
MYFLNPRLAADVFDGEYIIANLDTGLYYSIQGLAVSMVKALPFQDQNQVIRLLADTFPENAITIETELSAILKELLNEEIVKQESTATSTSDPTYSLPSEYVPSRFNRYADMQDLLMLDPIHDVDEDGWTVQSNDQQK